MSIQINKDACIKCGKCQEVCPGGLICSNEQGKAYVRYPKDCWGCASCVKECPAQAVQYFLGADIGGKGTYMYTLQKEEILQWCFIKPNKEKVEITTNTKESNKY